MFKIRIGSYCTYCFASCFLHFIKYQKNFLINIILRSYFLTATSSFLSLKLPGALKFLLSFRLLPLHTFPSQNKTIKRQRLSFSQYIVNIFRQPPRCCILFSVAVTSFISYGFVRWWWISNYLCPTKLISRAW